MKGLNNRLPNRERCRHQDYRDRREQVMWDRECKKEAEMLKGKKEMEE